jgi:ADP-ribose pyrophosphatase
VFAGGPVRAITVEHVVLPDGIEIPDYYRIELPDYALVFARTVDEHVIVFRQYKHGIGRVCLGFPGGALEPGEDPLASARRELLEETGYASDNWQALGEFVTNGNQHCNVAHLFIARNCRRTGPPTASDLENPECLLIPIGELAARMPLEQIGQISHVALLALALHPERA